MTAELAAPMRAALTIFVFTAISSAAVQSARAQTYDPNYPVCMQIYGPVGYFDCRYTSMQQCAPQASGRPAQCAPNPFWAGGATAPAQRRVKRQPRPD